jgi:ribosomal protein L11 methyltransferase
MPFLQLTLELGALDPSQAEAVCFAAGALAVTFSDARDDPVLEPAPDEVRLWPATRLTALFAGDTDGAAMQAALAAALGLGRDELRLEHVADRPWEREWLKDFHAMRFGERLWVCPQHEQVTTTGAAVVHLDPGLAFGTGTHPSTALCLGWLDEHLRPGARVIDYGCGSGILALAAAALGARCVECFDTDPQALLATQDNAARNGWADRVLVRSGDLELTPGADVLCANILSATLCTLAERFSELVRPGGRAVLGGILAAQTPEVTEAFAAWFDMCRIGEREEWVGLAGERRRR